MNINHRSKSFKYDPNSLLDTLCDTLNLRNDAALSRAIEVSPQVISKIRHFRLSVSALVLIRMHETTGWNIRDLRALMGDHREKFIPVNPNCNVPTGFDRVRGKPRRSGRVKSADGKAVLAFDFSAESAAVRCTVG